MNVTQELITQVLQASLCCEASIVQSIANRLKVGVDIECLRNEVLILSFYRQILQEYQWPTVEEPEVENCLSLEDLEAIILGINNTCSLFNCN